MKAKLTLLMITKNSASLLEKSLRSAQELVNEIVVVDGHSTDKTLEIAKKYKAKIFTSDEKDLGKKRGFGLTKVRGDWVLALDADEIISAALREEISSLFDTSTRCKGYMIPFQNHFLGKRLYFGGEDYKMLRLFRKDSATITPALVHEGFRLKNGQVGELKNKIHHYSYQSIRQIFSKFTDYAIREGRQKTSRGEKTNINKIVLYPLHMFWARFVEDKGYKDGFFRIPLDLGFAYMEFLTYASMLFIKRDTN